jgi:phospholipase D1/2
MDKQKAPFLKPPTGGFSGYQNFKIPLESRLWTSYHFGHQTSGVQGTCKVQILRSSAEWSSGINLEVGRRRVILHILYLHYHH